MRLRTALLLPVLAAALITSEEASAEPSRGSLAIVTIAGAQAERAVADQLSVQLAVKLAASDPILPEQAREELERSLGPEGLERATSRASAAYKALDAFDDLRRASRLLGEASEAFLDRLPLLETLDQPARLLLGLATVELAQGNPDGVNAALEAAVRLDPVLDLDPQETSPRLADAALVARETVGEGPLLLPERARQLGARLGVDEILLIQPRPGPGQTRVELYQSVDGARARSWQLEGRDLSQVARELRSQQEVGSEAATAAVSGDNAVEDSETARVFGQAQDDEEEERDDSPGRRPWYRHPAFWIALGLVVAGGAAAGVVLGLQASQEGPSPLPVEIDAHW